MAHHVNSSSQNTRQRNAQHWQAETSVVRHLGRKRITFRVYSTTAWNSTPAPRQRRRNRPPATPNSPVAPPPYCSPSPWLSKGGFSWIRTN